jgi:hypothetical protein
MKNDEELEGILRGLRPGPLPEDLCARMVEPPARIERVVVRFPWGRWLAGAGVVAACVAVWMSDLREQGGEATEGGVVSVRQRQSVLLESRSLAVIEHEGRVWEWAEEEWLDEDVAFCSATPVRVRSAVTRREVVCRPVDFD